MPLVADRVAETTTTTGTGTVTLAGAKTGYQAFTTAFSTGANVYYCITDNTDWEVGVGTFTTAGTTLSRDSIFASSNAGAAVNWGAGTKDVFCTAPMQSVVGAPRLQAKTGAYTVVASDNGSIINCTGGTFTVSLTAAATLGSGFTCWVWNTSTTSSHAITIDPSGAETIDDLTTLILRRGEGTQIVCDGTNWQTGDKKTMRGYAENVPPLNSRASAAGTESVAIGPFASTAGSRSIAFGYNANASVIRATAIGAGAFVSGAYSTALGLNSGGSGSQAVTGSGAMALGGSYASGTDSFAAAIANNTSSYGAIGANSVAVGYQAKAGTSYTTAIGYGATTSASYSLVLSTDYSSSATQTYSVAIGAGATSVIKGKFAYAGGLFAAVGDAQLGFFIFRRATTDATATVLTTNNTAPGTDDQVILPNNSAYAFTGTVVARRKAADGTESAAWKIEGLIRREGAANTTTLVASTVTAIDNTPGWTLALSADTTNGGLKIEATGAASTNIRWVATVQTSEVTYA